MYKEGIVLCADICNTLITFNIKKESRISYINLLEVFGIDPEKAGKRMDEIIKVVRNSQRNESSFFTGSSFGLFNVTDSFQASQEAKSENNKVTSIHFMETCRRKRFS